jgi:hypothetical protein
MDNPVQLVWLPSLHHLEDDAQEQRMIVLHRYLATGRPSTRTQPIITLWTRADRIRPAAPMLYRPEYAVPGKVPTHDT